MKALSAADIAALVPHAGSMCLLEGVRDWNDTHLAAFTTKHRAADNPLRHAGRLGAACGTEIAAQGMALHGALLAQQAPGAAPRAGFLVSMRDVTLHVTQLDTINTPLDIFIERLSGDANSVLYGFRLEAAGQALVTGRAAVMLDADA